MVTNAQSPRFYDGPSYSKDDVRMNYQYYTYPTDSGLVSAGVLSVMFTIDRPAKAIWPIFRDFNLWQNAYGYFYSGVIGDLEGKTFTLGLGEHDQHGAKRSYEVIRVIPQHLMVFCEPIPSDGSTGGVSPGFHAFVLSGFGDKTVMTYEGDHATRTQGKTEEEALGPWRELAARVLPMWSDSFIPLLKKLVYEGSKQR